MRRVVVAGICATAIATAPAAAADPSDGGFEPYGPGVPTIVSGGPMPSMNGVPCFGGHLGTCMSLGQNQPPPRKPSTGVGHSPTIRR